MRFELGDIVQDNKTKSGMFVSNLVMLVKIILQKVARVLQKMHIIMNINSYIL